jgi:hypothetical protein
MPESETVLKGQIEEVIFESETRLPCPGCSVAEIFIAVATRRRLRRRNGGTDRLFLSNIPIMGGSLNSVTAVPSAGQRRCDLSLSVLRADKGIAAHGCPPDSAVWRQNLEVLRHEPQEEPKSRIGQPQSRTDGAQRRKNSNSGPMLLLSPHDRHRPDLSDLSAVWRWAVERIPKESLITRRIRWHRFLTRIAWPEPWPRPDAPARLAGALKYRLLQALYEGNTWLPRTELLTDAARLIHQPEENLIPFLDDLIRKGDVIAFDSLQPLPADDLGPPGATDGDATRHGRRLALPGYFEIEKSAASFFASAAVRWPTFPGMWRCRHGSVGD